MRWALFVIRPSLSLNGEKLLVEGQASFCELSLVGLSSVSG